MEIFDSLISLLTLTALELVLGIDNIIILAILCEKLPKQLQPKARKIGLVLALVLRVLLLTTAVWITKMTKPLFVIFSQEISGRDLILFFGGLFLLAKATTEIFYFVEVKEKEKKEELNPKKQFTSVIIQIAIFDLIFSIDSILTAVGLAQNLNIMIAAVIIAVILMMFLAKPISDFVDRHPPIKILALAFLIMIGALLIAESFGSHVDKTIIYFAMGFSLFIEWMNQRRHKHIAKKSK